MSRLTKLRLSLSALIRSPWLHTPNDPKAWHSPHRLRQGVSASTPTNPLSSWEVHAPSVNTVLIELPSIDF